MSKFAFTCKVFGGNLVVSTDEYYKFNFFFYFALVEVSTLTIAMERLQHDCYFS